MKRKEIIKQRDFLCVKMYLHVMKRSGGTRCEVSLVVVT